MTGRVFGVAGGSLTDPSFLRHSSDGARTARVGKSGEIRTASIIDQFGSMDGGATVLHDLDAPSTKYSANIDHLIVSGNRVLIIDSKVWKPGRYVTIAGRTFRGFERFKPAEKKTMPTLVSLLDAYFANHGIAARIDRPLVTVWSSSSKASVKAAFLVVPGAAVISGDNLERKVRTFVRNGPADPAIVNALLPLLHGSKKRPGAAANPAPSAPGSHSPLAQNRPHPQQPQEPTKYSGPIYEGTDHDPALQQRPDDDPMPDLMAW